MATISATARQWNRRRRSGGWWRRFAQPAGACQPVSGCRPACCGAVGPLLYAVDPNYQNYTAINAWPSAAHPLGTDSLGRDTLARILAGRVSLIVVFYVELLNIGVGATLGLIAGFRRCGGQCDLALPTCYLPFPAAVCHLGGGMFSAALRERCGSGRRCWQQIAGIGELTLMALYARADAGGSSSVTSCWRRAASAPTNDAFWEGTFCPAYWA